MNKIKCVAAVMAALMLTPALAQAVDVRAFVKKEAFRDIKLSPNGDYYAATVVLEDRTALAIMRRSDNALTANFRLGNNTHVDNFWWVNPERVVISMAEKIGALDQPQATGELYAINADGGKPEFLVGQRMLGGGPGTKIQPKKVEKVAADLVDELAGNDKSVVVSISPFSADPFTRADMLDVYTGRRTQLARAPVRNASFVTDNQGVVRFALGSGTDNANKLYYREGDGAQWQLINDEAESHLVEEALGFSADDKVAYLKVEHGQGPDSIEAYDIASKQRKQVLRDDDTDPSEIIYRNGTRTPIGAIVMDGKPRAEFFDPAAPEARLYRSLEAAFGEPVRIASQTTDGHLALVQVQSDRNPGDFYIFDTVAKKASHLVSRRDWFAPEDMAAMKPIQLTARDGLPLHGYLTVPNGSTGKGLPMVVMPHGGPFQVRDVWGFSTDVQILANAGYAVLQVNFRGSPGYGRSFSLAGAKQYGGTMQDDLTDATHWAIKEGIADGQKICLYGASYGAYASLMGAAKEPALYRCAAGYVGIYDLPTLHTDGDVQERGSGETFLKEWVGSREDVAAVSPNRMADRIKVPVFLAAGGEDERAPIEHSRMMEQALRKAGVPVETLYYDTEGHGFYLEEHEREFYTRLLAFLSRSLGGAVATTGTSAPKSAK
ncbi:S9 family peptidase [Lysobacter sp. S4-A87]|uniref:alpha/beta hydrolase family protein n=1 Tax=Lysobacter sp. S4-A87 TaxID=2925843 RepID=UPI001F52CD92|nr:S9 family peptidase [Lysobacter sp. S4-A87]UNK50657.1 S9 family peptidase [Lysobacter sp. S4-A87]